MTEERCSTCGVSANNLKRCAGCRLPGIAYCSKECQRADWKRHKVDCKLSKVIDRSSDKLKLSYDYDDTAIQDYDAALQFAKNYMTNLKSLKIRLTQDGMWKQDEMNLFEFSTKEAVIKLTYDVFDDLLLSSATNLTSFEIVCDPCIAKYLYFFFKDGKILKRLAESQSLRQLVLSNMQVSKISYLPLPSSLEALHLNEVKFSKWDGPLGWSEEDCDEMVTRISQLTALVSLDLVTVPLGDHHLEPMLRNLSNLRHLRISGVWGDSAQATLREEGRITNDGCIKIAILCPNLHSLELSNQPNISYSGARCIVQQCRKLRDLRLENTNLTYRHASQLVDLNESQSLLVLAVGPAECTQENILKALKATGGRCLLYGESVGLHEAPAHGLSEIEKRQMDYSRSILIEASEKQENTTLYYDTYEDLVGVDVRIR
mmetsp:Transcript_2833/g.6663  ORF Transcript_2833/g.6663 Transcript_2833/m.6663 type:complete len:431 (+) Transcript_2833:117-1409(+)